MSKMIHPFWRLANWACLLLALTSLELAAKPIEALKPTRSQAITSMMVLKQLQQAHYNRMAVNTDLSSRVFDRYLQDLDRNRLHFTAEDIKEFERFRFELDKALQNGNLAPAFIIFNRYQERSIERLEFVLNLLQNRLDTLDLNRDEYFESDRRTASWPADNKALDDLWRRRIKHLVLNSVLSGKTTEKAAELLVKRFRNQLNRTLQINADDAFQFYMNAMTQTFDPHTQYLPPRASENFNINMSLQLQGIGAVLQAEDEYTKIIRLVPGGPAERSRLLAPADRIIGVAQGEAEMTDVIGWRLDEVVDLIRGEKGSTVKLEIIPATAKSESETRIVSLIRDTVKLEDRAAQKKMLELDVEGKARKFGVISIPTFYADYQGKQTGNSDYKSTTKDVMQHIEELKTQGMEGLIIDLRNNGGGFLEEANSLVGLFIESGPTVQVRYANGKIDEIRDTRRGVFYEGPLVVIVNRLSASASEIFAGAIQDYERGIVFGERTFGKGTVQALQPLDRGQLKITQAMFYRISGQSNQHSGIVPDVTVPSLIDAEEIGESALENALPASNIRPASFSRQGDISRYINYVRAAHDKRMAQDPEYVFLKEKRALLDETRDIQSISLNLKTRQEEKAQFEARRLQLENTKRKALDLEPLKNYEELAAITGENDENALPKDESVLELDFVIHEAGHILKDVINLRTDVASLTEHSSTH
jgi:carboxyl-terminal processing protease